MQIQALTHEWFISLKNLSGFNGSFDFDEFGWLSLYYVLEYSYVNKKLCQPIHGIITNHKDEINVYGARKITQYRNK